MFPGTLGSRSILGASKNITGLGVQQGQEAWDASLLSSRHPGRELVPYPQTVPAQSSARMVDASLSSELAV